MADNDKQIKTQSEVDAENAEAARTEEEISGGRAAESEENALPEGSAAEGNPPPSVSSEAGDPSLKPQKRKRGANIFWNIFLVAVIAFGILSLFGIVKEVDPQSGASFGEVMRGASPSFFAVLIIVVLMIMVFDVAKYCIISKTVTGKVSVATSAKTNFLGRYYDAVTPFATGGQPMQIYYLTTKGVSGGNSTAMVLIRYYSSIMCWILLGGAMMIFGAVRGVLDGVSGGTVLKITGWIGIGINLIIPVFVTLFLILPNFMQKLTEGVVKIGHKLKIVKDVEKTTARATKVVSDFKNSFKLMVKSPVKLILLILVSLGESFLTFATPFFVMKAFSCNVDGMLFTVMALNSYATFGVSFIPTPGNSGVVEGMGALAFSAAAGATLAWSVLAWRLSVFYLYIIIGLCMTVYDIIMKNVKYKKSKKGL